MLLFLLALASCGRRAGEESSPAPRAEQGRGAAHAPAAPQPGRGDPAARDARIAEAERALAAGDWKRAWNKLEKALRAGPETPRLRILRGVCASNLDNDLERARREFERAAAMAPGDPEPWRRLAQIALSVGDVEESRRLVERALRADPGDEPSLLLRARLLREGGDPEEALRVLGRLEGGGDAAALLRAKALADLGREEEALRWVERALTDRPTDPAARFLRMRLLLALGRTAEAERERRLFERLRPLFSESPHDREPDPEKRLRALRSLCADRPEWWRPWAERAKLERALVGLDAARRTLEEALAHHPDVAALHALLADAHRQAGDADAARREEELARRLAGDGGSGP